MVLNIDLSFQQAINAHNTGNLQEAESLYRTILQTQPTHPHANHNLGVIISSTSNPEASLPLFKAALQFNPNVEQFWISYIDALIKENQFENAKLVLKKGKKVVLSKINLEALNDQLIMRINNPEPSNTQLQTLLKYYQDNQHDNAEKLAILITEQFPNNQFSWKVLGALLTHAGRISGALGANQKAAELAPQDAEAHSNLGNTLTELGKLKEAEASHRQAIALKPDFADIYCNFGHTLQKIGRLEEAEANHRQAIALNPEYVMAHNNLSVTLRELGRLEEAEVSCRQTIALNPNYVMAYNNLGCILKELGRLEESQAILRQAIMLKPDLAISHNNLGNTLQELGRLEEGEASFRHALALKPEFAEAMLNLSIILLFMNNIDEAVILLENTSIIDRDNCGLRASVILAIFCFLEGDFLKSKKHLLASSKIQKKITLEFNAEKKYQIYLLKILNWHENKFIDSTNLLAHKKLYVIGESHSLVSHGLHIEISNDNFLCRSLLIIGCKQWHLGNSIKNKYKNQFELTFNSIPKSSNVLLAIGEIDCRLDSGIIKHRDKFPERNIIEITKTTVENYLNYVCKINSYYKHKIIIQGVPCPIIETKVILEDKTLELVNLIKDFNILLKIKSLKMGFGFLDVHKITDRGDGFSNLVWHIDSNHLSPEGIQEAWRTSFFD